MTLFDRELNENPDINQYEQKIRRNGICRDKDKMQWRNRFDSVERLTVECFPWGYKSYFSLFFLSILPFFTPFFFFFLLFLLSQFFYTQYFFFPPHSLSSFLFRCPIINIKDFNEYPKKAFLSPIHDH